MLRVRDDKLAVVWNGKVQYYINGRLLTRQNVVHNLNKIKRMHQTKLDIYDAIKKTRSRIRMGELVVDLTRVEFELQKLWGFPEDARFHRFWDTPRCECASMDNNDAYPSGYYSINSGCPVHGMG